MRLAFLSFALFILSGCFTPRANQEVSSISAINAQTSRFSSTENSNAINDSLSLRGRVAVILGASSGIGKAIALQFAKSEAKVMLFARRDNLLKEVSAEISAMRQDVSYVVGDISREKDVSRLIDQTIKKFGRIDVLICNAAIFEGARLENLTLESFERVIKTNLTGTFLAVKKALPYLVESKGKIILISSISGPRTGYPGEAHYTASKAGMNGFMKTAAIEVAKHGITINAIEPGSINTEILAALPIEKTDAMIKAIPMNRLGRPEEIANVALFLASPMASFITGQSIIVDGGQLLPESHHFKY